MQLDDVNILKTERTRYIIVWSKFKIGSSFFWPCYGIDCPQAKEEVLRKAKRAKVKVKMKLQTEEEVQGLRVWRVG